MGNKQTAIQLSLVLIDRQIKLVIESKKGKDSKFKYGADAAISNLVYAKIMLKELLPLEREQIEQSYRQGSYDEDCKNYIEFTSPSDYYTKTFNTFKL
jgi:hypothetical protein